MRIKQSIVLICSLAMTVSLLAQPLEVVGISVDGNEKTKERIILRELDFTVGDTLSQETLGTRLERNRSNLLKTGLFTEVSLNISDWNIEQRRIMIAITLSESWYIFPVPLFELADRNFNVWWTEQNRSISRVNVGMRVQILNLNGMNDYLKFKFQVGYTPKFEGTYLIPFVNRKQTIGLEINALRSVNKEIALFNEHNKQIFFEHNDLVIFRRSRVRIGASYRPNLYHSHRFRLAYQNHRVDEVVVEDNNPDFFLNGRTHQEFLAFEYRYVYDNRDRAILPTRGWFTGIEMAKEGLGVFDDLKTFSLQPFVEKYMPIANRITAGIGINAKWSLNRKQQPYYNYRGLGYFEDYLRGYELYVVDGLDFIYLKNSISFRLADATFNWKRKMPIKSFRNMPWQLYLSFNYDVGYVNDPYYDSNNSFTNRWLHGAGIGVNVLLYNIFMLQVEFSANHLGEKGLFLHSKTSF